MGVTLQQIADELNVSAVTVSRALRHDRSISPETRARVNEAANRLGYQSRDRRPRRATGTATAPASLGLLMSHSSLAAAQHDTNLMRMMAGMMAVTDDNEMHFKVHPWHAAGVDSVNLNEALLGSLVVDERCQALIVHGEKSLQDLGYLSQRLPVVSIGRRFAELPIDAAIADNAEGVRQLVTHLAGLGHRKMAWVGASLNASFMAERRAGFVNACLALDLELGPGSMYEKDLYLGSGTPGGHLQEALRRGFTAFVCGNDGTAMELIATLEKHGVRVPQDVSVVGFDASLRSNPASYRPMTSFDPYFFEMGQAAARLALQRMAQPTMHPCTVVVRGALVRGESDGPAPEPPR